MFTLNFECFICTWSCWLCFLDFLTWIPRVWCVFVVRIFLDSYLIWEMCVNAWIWEDICENGRYWDVLVILVLLFFSVEIWEMFWIKILVAMVLLLISEERDCPFVLFDLLVDMFGELWIAFSDDLEMKNSFSPPLTFAFVMLGLDAIFYPMFG